MSQLRRLPVYLMLDCSESMAGPAIESVAKGVQLVHEELRSNPLAIETAYLSVITFNRYAKQVVPLTEVLQFTPPPLSVRTGSALGAALTLLLQCMKKEVVRTTATTKGDYKPLVFLLTDGQPTDAWEPAADALRAANNPRIANIYAIGCGPDVDTDSLRRITDIVLMMSDLSPEGFKKFFVWLSASVQTASARLDAAGGPIDMPPLPDSIAVAPPSMGVKDELPRQVFLQARCQKTKKPYLMRFARQGRRYEAISAHPLEVIEEDAGDYLPPISSSLLDGCPDCPYCNNEVAGKCPCGVIFCNDINPRGPVICPACNSELTAGDSRSFKIRRSQG
jgi:uncharacterized protein YegL